MKIFSGRLIMMVLIAVVFSLCSHEAAAGTLSRLLQNEVKERSVNIDGQVINAVTGLGIRNDTIKVELMYPDSTLIDYTYTQNYVFNNSNLDVRTVFRLQCHVKGDKFLLRLTSPDFETVYYDITVKGHSFSTGKLDIRRLSKFEKARMLDEVVVKASVIAFVNKGDTIQYNADAFQVAQGSMLDALIEQMPGVELRDDGRIYVNGRFVDKLLLDGKDFFKGNQLVMLQNLPAYSVKDIKVYEKAGNITEVLGKGATDQNSPDEYVMDVSLKKGYNAGWLANAEAGLGTHQRYRERAFGMGYTKKIRLSAYGMLNNVNETRNPGRSGEWNPMNNDAGKIATKKGGIEIGVFKDNNEYTGNFTTSYKDEDKSVITARENFLNDGNTYLRSWDNSRERQFMLNTNHSLTLRPKDGNRYNTKVVVDVSYATIRQRENSVQGTFNRSQHITASLRDSLQTGMPGGQEIINRYLNEVNVDAKYLNASWMQQTTLRFGNSNNGLTISSDGYYQKINTDGTNNNLLQYAGENPQIQNRWNPTGEHSYKYWFGLRPQIRLSSVFNLQPLFAVCHRYEYNNKMWYVSEGLLTGDPENKQIGMSERLLPSMIRDVLMRLDPNNSYTSGFHHTHQYGQLSFTYYKESQIEGRKNSSLQMSLYGGVNHITRKLTFTGIDRQVIKRDYFEPEGSFFLNWELPGLAHRLSFRYQISGTGLDMMNLVDVTFNSDPLNQRQGNPDLKTGYTHRFSLNYQGNKRILGRLLFGAGGEYEIKTRAVAMSQAYDRETGVRIRKPVNINGGRNGSVHFSENINLTRNGKFTLSNYTWLLWTKFVDMISYDNFSTTQKTGINDFYLWNNLGLEYNIGRNQVAFDALIDTHHTSANRSDFKTLNTPSFLYGFRGRVVLPFDIEISSDIKMFQRRGHDDRMMNVNALLWNASITKSLLKKRLILGVQGYDILGNVQTIGYSINALNRTETWTSTVPSYLMFSIQWNFSKKPKE